MAGFTKPPTGFARATGNREGRRRCLACGKLYPVVDPNDTDPCPHCNSTNTEPVKLGTGNQDSKG